MYVNQIVTRAKRVPFRRSVTLNQKAMRGAHLQGRRMSRSPSSAAAASRPIPKPLRIAVKANQETGGGA